MIKIVALSSTILISLLLSSFTELDNKIGAKRLAKIEENVEKMTEVMELSESQRSAVLELKKVAEIKVQEASKKYEKGSTELDEARRRIGRNYQSALRRIVSLEQISKWKEYKKMKNTSNDN